MKIAAKILATNAVTQFKCLQADCPDTCCKGWSMQLDDATYSKYKGTDLENAVSFDGDLRVMKRDPKTDYCVKFEGGICGIHKEKGPELLGDACNMYPRITRSLGEQTIMTMTPSCPEALRLMLAENAGAFTDFEIERLPASIKDWMDEGVAEADALAIHQRFIAECSAEISPEVLVARIYSVSRSFEYIERPDWAGAVDFMFRMADGKLAASIKNEMDDYNILQLFLGILHATGKSPSPRLGAVLGSIAATLGVEINYQTLGLAQTDFASYARAKKDWAESKGKFDGTLKKYIAAQISFSTYPFAGVGDELVEKAMVLAFKFALMRLALMSNPDGNVVDIIQPISRIIDHLADAQLTLSIMNNFGWGNEPQLLGLVAG